MNLHEIKQNWGSGDRRRGTCASAYGVWIAFESTRACTAVACIAVDTIAMVAGTSIGRSLVDSGLLARLPCDSPFHHDRGSRVIGVVELCRGQVGGSEAECRALHHSDIVAGCPPPYPGGVVERVEEALVIPDASRQISLAAPSGTGARAVLERLVACRQAADYVLIDAGVVSDFQLQRHQLHIYWQLQNQTCTYI